MTIAQGVGITIGRIYTGLQDEVKMRGQGRGPCNPVKAKAKTGDRDKA